MAAEYTFQALTHRELFVCRLLTGHVKSSE